MTYHRKKKSRTDCSKKRDPVTHRSECQQRKHTDDYKSKPEQVAANSARHTARNRVNAERKKQGKGKLATNQHVDHKKRISEGGTNARSNLRIKSASANSAGGGRKKKSSKTRPSQRIG